MIRRGTTPTARFTISGVDVTLFENIYITFKQGKFELTKTGEDVEINSEDNTISTKLTQEETLMFNENPLTVQIRAKTYTGDALASQIISDEIEKILMDGVI